MPTSRPSGATGPTGPVPLPPATTGPTAPPPKPPAPTPPPAKPAQSVREMALPTGVTLADLERWFTAGMTSVKFDESHGVVFLWVEEGVRTGCWPGLADNYTRPDKVTVFRFFGGLTILATADRAWVARR